MCRLPNSLFGQIPQSALPINLTVPDFFLLMSPKPTIVVPAANMNLHFALLRELEQYVYLRFVAGRYAEFKQRQSQIFDCQGGHVERIIFMKICTDLTFM
jgi:hypothetical protein